MGPENRDQARESQIERIQRETKEAIRQASIELLGATCDASLAFAARLAQMPGVPDAIKQGIDRAADIICAFSDEPIVQVTYHPRRPRPQDTVVFHPGEHKGVAIQFVTESGQIGGMNIYGGLRDFYAPQDVRDTDQQMQRHHATRTDQILSHSTQINFHMPDIQRQGFMPVDIWMAYNLNSQLRLSALSVEGERIQATSVINNQDTDFTELRDKINFNTRVLTTLIPSAE